MEQDRNLGIDRGRFEVLRQTMVSNQLRTNAVSDPGLVAIMGRVPREHFFSADVAGLAYRDTAIPLGNGRYANLPMATGRLLAEAAVLPTETVLLIGAASGYTAALLAEIASQIVAVESDPDLARHARAALLDWKNVELVEGPLEQGWPKAAPYDVVVIDGAIEHLPTALIDQLVIGGRLVSGRLDNGVTRLAIGHRTAGGFGLIDFADIDCVRLPGFALPPTFVF